MSKIVEIHHSPDVIVLRKTDVADDSWPMNDGKTSVIAYAEPYE